MTIIALVFLYLLVALYGWDLSLRGRRAAIAMAAIQGAILVLIVLCGSDGPDWRQWLLAGGVVLFLTALTCVSFWPETRRWMMRIVMLAQLALAAGLSAHLAVFWSRLMLVPAAFVAFAHVFYWRRGCEQQDNHSHKRSATFFSVVAVALLYCGFSGLFAVEWRYGWQWIKPLMLAHGVMLVYIGDSLLGYGLFCSNQRSRANIVLSAMLFDTGLLLLALGSIIDCSGLY